MSSVLYSMSIISLWIVIMWVSAATAHILPKPDGRRAEETDSEGSKCFMQKRFRPAYHITAPNGWLSYPAGLAYFHGQYHVFYQYHPFKGSLAYMHWGHAVSDDLVFWTSLPPALVPKETYERYGCLGGTALVHNKYLTLLYTGIHETAAETVVENQNMALSLNGVTFNKYNYNPVIQSSPYGNQDGVQGFRNPKVWSSHTTWYMIVGAMSDKQRGQLLLYTSKNMLQWRFNATIAESFGDLGYMWESPDYFDLDGMHVLLLSARGMEPDGFRFRNPYQCGYIIGDLNYHLGRFNDPFELSAATFNELDSGHDFYAAKTVQAADGRVLVIAWLGMEESNCVETRYGWASMLTIFRELTLSKDGRLLMQPIREMRQLRGDTIEDSWYQPGEALLSDTLSFELLVNSTLGANEVGIIFDIEGDLVYFIGFSAVRGFVTVNRKGTEGMRRASWAPAGDAIYWRIFFDKSSIEVFCGEGEVTFSSRLYPKMSDKGIRIRVGGDTKLHLELYKMKRSILLPAES